MKKNYARPLTSGQVDRLESMTLSDRVKCAVYVSVMGADRVGIATQLGVVYPSLRIDAESIEKEAAELLGVTASALLEVLPPQEIEQILQARAERLSFAE